MTGSRRMALVTGHTAADSPWQSPGVDVGSMSGWTRGPRKMGKALGASAPVGRPMGWSVGALTLTLFGA
jgi:hypothetical protein